jgi:hypothetical protein
MARRTRGLLIDSTLGKVWSNIDDVASGNASLLIAGTKLQSKVFSQSSTTVVRAATNLGLGTGFYFPTQTLITSVGLTLTVSKNRTANINITVKSSADTYANASTLGTYTISKSNSSQSATTSLSVAAGSYVYFDLTTGDANAQGLSITLNYYAS